MGTRDVARADIAAISGIARQYDAVSAMVDAAVRTHLDVQAFGASTAGRSHIARGEALGRAVDEVADRMRQWGRAAAEVAAALHASADRYSQADARAADRLG